MKKIELLKLKVSSINDTKSNCNGTVSIPFLKEYRYGNKLFIYFSARIYAELNKLNLITNIDDIYYDLKPTKNYGKPPKNLKTFIIQDKDYNKTKNKINFKGKGNYVFNGYFQFEEYFYKNKNIILHFINLNDKKINKTSLHLRLDDFRNDYRTLVININYYVNSVKYLKDDFKPNLNHVTIICDRLKKKWEIEYVEKLKSELEKIKVKSSHNLNSISEDIKILTCSKFLITSNSTFCFWSVFFSKAEKIIQFPFCGEDLSRNNTFYKWNNNAVFFKKQDDVRMINNLFSINKLDYFEKYF